MRDLCTISWWMYCFYRKTRKGKTPVFERISNASVQPIWKSIDQNVISCKNNFQFHRHIVSETGLKTDADKNKAVLNFPMLRNHTWVKSILSVVSQNWHFQLNPNFSLLLPEFHKNLAGQHWLSSWLTKQNIQSVPWRQTWILLEFWQSCRSKKLINTHASSFAMGEVPAQAHAGNERCICYA